MVTQRFWARRDGFAVDVLACPTCQGRMKLLALVKGPARRGTSASGGAIAWSADGRRLVSTADDGALRFWDAQDGRLLASLYVPERTDDWLLLTPDGRLDGSGPALRKHLAWRMGDRVARDDREPSTRRTPGLWRTVAFSP